MVKLGLEIWGFDRTYRFVHGAFSVGSHALPAIDPASRARSTMSMVRAASVYGVCEATCLPQSLVAWALLRRQGLDPKLRIGARKRAGVLEAHAWIELGPTSLDGASGDVEESFVAFEIAG
jgi:hypothetical protein